MANIIVKSCFPVLFRISQFCFDQFKNLSTLMFDDMIRFSLNTPKGGTPAIFGPGVEAPHFANTSGGHRRARNISESELFPDSYKFSPSFPSVNICFNEMGSSSLEEKNIWDMEHKENDSDYINRQANTGFRSLFELETYFFFV